jgi:hypothetical protein
LPAAHASGASQRRETRFPKGWRTPKPYMRIVTLPGESK